MKRHLQISSDIFSDMCSDVVSDKYSDVCSVNLHATNSVTSPLTFSHGSHGIFIYSIPTVPGMQCHLSRHICTHCTLTHCCSCLPQILWLLMVRLRNYRIHMPLHCKIFWHIPCNPSIHYYFQVAEVYCRLLSWCRIKIWYRVYAHPSFFWESKRHEYNMYIYNYIYIYIDWLI